MARYGKTIWRELVWLRGWGAGTPTEPTGMYSGNRLRQLVELGGLVKGADGTYTIGEITDEMVARART